MRRLAALLLAPLLVLGVACGDDDDDDVAAGDNGGGGGSSASFCAEAETLQAQFDQLDETFGEDALPDSATFEQAAQAIERLADDAPGEIKADLELVATAVTRFAEVFAEIDLSDPNAFTDPEVMAELEAAGEELEELGGDMEEAGERVEAYLEEECGLEIDGGAGDETEDVDVDAEVDADVDADADADAEVDAEE